MSDTVRSLTAVGRVTEGLTFFNFLVDHEICRTVCVLLIEGSHAELLMGEGLLLATRGTVCIVGIAAELLEFTNGFLAVITSRNCLHATKVSLIF